MFDQANGGSTEPKHVIESLTLDIDLTKADLDFPQFNDQLAKCRIVGATVKPNKAEDGRNLVITFLNENPITSTKGREFAPGKRTFIRHYSLQPSKKSPEWDWTQPLAQLQQAACGGRETKLDLPALAGKVVYIRLKYDAKADANQTSVDAVISCDDVESGKVQK